MRALLAQSPAVLLGVADAKLAFAPVALPVIFMFIGAFMLAQALTVHGFDRRAALWLLSRPILRGSPARALLMVAATAFSFSMWINNTATVAMMCPIAVGLCASIRALCPKDAESTAKQRAFEEGMLITLACAASLGGVCTPVGTAPNMIAIAQIEEAVAVHFDFLRWMAVAVPVALPALFALLLLARRRWPPALEHVPGLSESVSRELDELGLATSAERRSVFCFAVAIFGWLTPSLLRIALSEEAAATSWARRAMPEGVVAVLAGTLLFILPSGAKKQDSQFAGSARVLEWRQAADIDWGTVLLLGGGLALGNLAVHTGLADALGASVSAYLGDEPSSFALIAVVTVLVVYMTELVSNTATVNMLLPVIIPVAVGSGADPVPVVLTASFAASFAFMLPVSTPPNAVVYGTGLIQLPTMLRFGARLNLVGIALLVAAGCLVIPALSTW